MMRGARDRLEGVSEPGVIYALDCKACPRVYIGETARTAKQRTREHKCHTNCSKRELSAVAAHAIDEGHEIHWEPRVVAREGHSLKRRTREAFYIDEITRRGHSMNQDHDLELSNLRLEAAKKQ